MSGLRLARAADVAPLADTLLQRMRWLNEPPAWRIEGDRMIARSTPKADFYRLSHWVVDNGNFFHLPVTGDFRFSARTAGEYRAKYDQIGLMMRLDPEHWVKCGNEFVDGQLLASAVVTQEHSDWSVSTALPLTTQVWWQLERSQDRVKASYSLDGKEFTMIREGHFPAGTGVDIGLLCASPEGLGVAARFDSLKLEEL